MKLSKSLYTRGIQCEKSLWLKKYNPHILTPPNQQALEIFQTGDEVGQLACSLFPNGKKVTYTSDFKQMINQTQKLLKQKTPFIYEATFEYEGILVMVDILQIDKNTISIYEVKSSTQIKDIYLHDAAIQYYVLSNLGYKIEAVYLVHINKNYIKEDELDLEELFTKKSVTQEVKELQESVKRYLHQFEKTLNQKDEPDIDIGKHCNKPYECDCKNYCWNIQKKIPSYSIFNIFGVGSQKQIQLYEKGIIDIKDIPDDFQMTSTQALNVAVEKTQEKLIDKEKIASFCKKMQYPLYHLDFETFQEAIPQYKNTKPYEKIPFQYSLHIEHENGVLEHKEFLADENSDPRFALTQRLCQDIPQDAMVLAYNMGFEKSVIKNLANLFPTYKSHLLTINENMQDLMTPFQKRWYITPQMQGSYSIKKVLPALAPNIQASYQNLDTVQNGTQAMHAYKTLKTIPQSQKENIKKALLNYCCLDTLAMVKICKALKRVTS